MVLLPAGIALGAAYYSQYKQAMMKRYQYGRLSQRRSRRHSLRSLTRGNYKKGGQKAGRVPKTLNVPTQSIGQRWWPRFSTLGPIGKSTTAQLTYCSQPITLSNSTGGVTGPEHVFALNGLFDPDLTGVGHQPMGFDQWAPFFNLYKVHKVDIKIRTFAAGNAALNSFIAAKITASQDSSTAIGLTFDYCSEQRTIAVKTVYDPNEDTIYRSFNIREIEGHNIMDDNYGATFSGNPGNLVKLHLAVGNNSATDTGSLQVIVELVYHVVFYNRKSLGQS